ncbi:50S ribosomal protein L32 [Candidatus Peregrinibacteria bacterium]|nr:50S ribosomal protein L32 [Candidatus Peregrinibacteria bacterium]
MPKHPVPKKKTAKAKTKTRYGSFKTKTLKKLSNRVNLVDCPNCGSKALAHTACPQCGQYRGRQIIDKQKEVEKITKIKA